MPCKDNIFVAYVSGAHGIQGAVTIKNFSEHLSNYQTVYDDSAQAYELEWIRQASKHTIVKFKNVTTRSQAESLKSMQLFVKKEQLSALDSDEFYHNDLIGLQALDAQQNKYGAIIAIHNFGAGELLEVAGAQNKSFLVPFTERYIPIVNIEDKSVLLSEEALVYTKI